jgi:hypothetical protein
MNVEEFASKYKIREAKELLFIVTGSIISTA